MTRAKRTRKKSPSKLRRLLPWLLAAGVPIVLAWLFLPFWRLSGQFGSHPSRQPSRLYGRPAVIEPGGRLDARGLEAALEAAGYLRDERLTTRGSFRQREGRIELRRRRFPSPRGWAGGDRLEVHFAGSAVDKVVRDGSQLAGVWLDPPLIASFYGSDLQERRPVTLDQLPEDLILSVLAAEDANFLEHPGLSLRGILRAAWTNFRANEVRQGGSTLTQQLVKNIYLSHERRWGRKAQEALLALLLEARYEKRTILQAYLNEIYWGRSGSVDLMGVGAAAWAYFGKTPDQLSLSEAAILAGMVQSPGNLSPLASPEAARARRDVVLGRLAQLNWVEAERLEQAAREAVTPQRGVVARRAPYFTAAMAAEAARRFGLDQLDDAGYMLHSTLDLKAQEAAEKAVRETLTELEKSYEKKRPGELQAALVAIDPATGGLRAYVGGRDFGRSQYDRVSSAERQAGSAFKPIVYAAAFERRVANPATFLEDEPYSFRSPSGLWQPKNSDGTYRGWVSARTALENSYNVPTARLAVDMGMTHVVDMAKRLGIRRSLRPLPALALGAMEVTPLEMATVYATFAHGGRRQQPHGLVAVFDRQGKKVEGQQIAAATQELSEEVAFLINKVLQGVPLRGTAKKLRAQGLRDPVAAKTGTSNDRRDSWFAAYSPELATLVWVGYDDNSATRLSGARGAAPVWKRFADEIRPPGGFRDFEPPGGVVVRLIDPRSGGVAHAECSERQREYFLRDFVPGPYCADDSGWRERFRSEDGAGKGDHPFRRWLRMLGDG
ncbi:MAG: PBP1A family penicillin-binding protein [Acidobacteriota bacterium]